MTYRGHAAVGGLIAYGAWKWASPGLLPAGLIARALLLAFVLIGALAPDLDTPQSYLSRRLLGPLRFGVVLFKWGVSNPLTWMLFGRKRIVRIVRHRGFSHSILGIAIATLTLGAALVTAAAVLAPVLGGETLIPGCCDTSRTLTAAVFAAELTLAFGLGCASHLFADALTVSGVPLFLPWSDRRVAVGPRFLRLRSN